jgi:hypothetical protein
MQMVHLQSASELLADPWRYPVNAAIQTLFPIRDQRKIKDVLTPQQMVW